MGYPDTTIHPLSWETQIMVRHGQSGYVGSSKSVRAVAAENDGRFPLTRATSELSKLAGATKAAAKRALIACGPCEWHHTSKHANKTDYYRVAAGAFWLKHASAVEALDRLGFRRVVSDAANEKGTPVEFRVDRICEAFKKLAVDAGCDVEIVSIAYYGTWNDFDDDLKDD